MYCRCCGGMVSERALSCPNCGEPFVVPNAGGGKSRGTAIALALLLGGLGIHKFYLGQTLAGFLYLLFCWTYVPAVMALCEAINYMWIGREKFQEKYK